MATVEVEKWKLTPTRRTTNFGINVRRLTGYPEPPSRPVACPPGGRTHTEDW